MLPKVVITHWVHPEVIDYLSAYCQVVPNRTLETLPREEILRRAADAEGLMAFMPDRVDAEFLQACPELRVIGAALKGYDNLDAEACAEAGVALTIVDDLLTAPTAELAVTLLLALIRKVRAGDALVRSGGFSGWRPILYGAGLSGSTVGLVGMGAVGKAVARRLVGFDARLTYYDPCPLDPDGERALRLKYCDFPELLRESDHLVVSVPLARATRHLFDADILAQVKPGCFLVNIGRGSVMDEAAVAAALRNGQLAGFAADVFAFEDQSFADRPAGIHPDLLAQEDRTIFTPHLGSAVDSVRRDIAMVAAENILVGLLGKPQAKVVGCF